MTNIKSLLKISLPILIPLFFIIFLAGGCSFKLIDPQYYEFRKLCKEKAGAIIYNIELFENYKSTKWKSIKPNDITNGRIRQFYREEVYFDNILVKKHIGFIYMNYGLFLEGDEGAGFGLNYAQKIGCNENNKYIWVETGEQSYGEGGYAEADDGTIYRFNGGKINAK